MRCPALRCISSVKSHSPAINRGRIPTTLRNLMNHKTDLSSSCPILRDQVQPRILWTTEKMIDISAGSRARIVQQAARQKYSGPIPDLPQAVGLAELGIARNSHSKLRSYQRCTKNRRATIQRAFVVERDSGHTDRSLKDIRGPVPHGKG